MEKSPARLTDEAENERKKLSRETQAATGPVPDAISTENEEQITAANLERRRKNRVVNRRNRVPGPGTTNQENQTGDHDQQCHGPRPGTNIREKLEEAQNSVKPIFLLKLNEIHITT
jgi:hypothetical protein